MGVIDAAAVNKKVESLEERIEYLELQLAKAFLLLEGHDLVFWREDNRKEVKNGKNKKCNNESKV